MMAVTFAEANVDMDVGVKADRKLNCDGKPYGVKQHQAKHLYNTKAVKTGS